MKPLATTQRILAWLFICRDENPSNRWKKFAQICFVSFVLMISLIHFSGSILFAIKFFSIDLKKTASALVQVFAFIPVIYILTIALILRDQIIEIFSKLKDIYDERE